VMLGEKFPNRLRAAALSVAASAQWLANWAITTITETNGRELEEMPARAPVSVWPTDLCRVCGAVVLLRTLGQGSGGFDGAT